ncbi:hypothetical protein HDU96_010165 [Phlyctochytrium bullatum]|nr:hypothetical protein HDU96_010165 [Phlyctochytrium bullatum]
MPLLAPSSSSTTAASTSTTNADAFSTATATATTTTAGAPPPKESDEDDDEPDFLRHFKIPVKPSSSSTTTSVSPLPPPRPSPTLPAPAQPRPALFDLAALAHLGKSIYSLLTDPPSAPTQQQPNLEGRVAAFATAVASAVTFDPETSVPVVTAALEDGIRVTVKVMVSNPTPLPVFLPGPFDLDLLFQSQPIGHVQLSSLRLAPYETYPHAVHVLFAPQTPDAMLAGGRFLGLLASGRTGLAAAASHAGINVIDGGIGVEVGVKDLGSLVRGLAVPEAMKKVLWDAIHFDAVTSSPPADPLTPPPSPPAVALPGTFPATTAPTPSLLPPLRRRLSACLQATRVTRPIPPPLPDGMIVAARFRLPGGGFGVGTASRGRAVAWCQLRNPFEADVTVLRVVGRARVPTGTGDGWRTIGTVDAEFPVPDELGTAAGSPRRRHHAHAPVTPSPLAAPTPDPFVIPYTTLNPRVAVMSPPIDVEAAVDCRAFGSLIRAIRRKLECTMRPSKKISNLGDKTTRVSGG